MLHDPVADRYWDRLFTEFADFQIVVCDSEDGVVTVGNTIPFTWNGLSTGLPAGWDAVLEQGFREREHGGSPTALSVLLAIVAREHQGRRLSYVILNAMRIVAAEHGLGSLVAPVRPTMKSLYPLTPIEDYIGWALEDGERFDPWLRVHERLGAEILRVAPRSMVISGKVSDWEGWTDMGFPCSGEYVVPGALQPVAIDLGKDLGVYEEPNVWMQPGVPLVDE